MLQGIDFQKIEIEQKPDPLLSKTIGKQEIYLLRIGDYFAWLWKYNGKNYGDYIRLDEKEDLNDESCQESIANILKKQATESILELLTGKTSADQILENADKMFEEKFGKEV